MWSLWMKLEGHRYSIKQDFLGLGSVQRLQLENTGQSVINSKAYVSKLDSAGGMLMLHPKMCGILFLYDSADIFKTASWDTQSDRHTHFWALIKALST